MLPINFECFVASAACLIIVPRAADGAVNYEALGQRRPLCICAFVLMKNYDVLFRMPRATCVKNIQSVLVHPSVWYEDTCGGGSLYSL